MTNSNTADDITANYHRGNPRSVEANDATRSRKSADCIRILAALRLQPAGLTCDEAEQVLGMSHQTCSARFADMKRKGWLVIRGKRKTRSNCWADVHFEVRAKGITP